MISRVSFDDEISEVFIFDDVGSLEIRMTPGRRSSFPVVVVVVAAVVVNDVIDDDAMNVVVVVAAVAAAAAAELTIRMVFFDDSPLFWNRVGSLIFLPDLLLLTG